MAKRQFQLNDNQVQELRRYEQRSKRPAELKRLQAVRLYGRGRALSDILDIVGCGESSVRIWAMHYSHSGVSGLLANYKQSSQNARKLTHEQEHDLCEKLKQYRPMDVMPQEMCDGNGEFWTVEDVKHMMGEWYGVHYQDVSSYRNVLRRCGFSYQKAEQVYKSRPSQVAIADFEADLEKK